MLDIAEPVERSDHACGLAARFEQDTAEGMLREAILDFFKGRIALVSSFGADSAVLLHMVGRIDPATPIIFVDTGHLFAETIAYRDELATRFGLTDVRTVRADETELSVADPDVFLWSSDPGRCCRLRKVVPLARALDGFDAWISGRKRFQASTRMNLSPVEAEGRRTKLNPLANWSANDLLHYMNVHDLPRHELVAKRYLSIGCIPCTSPVRPGEDPRAGRWRGQGKTECGIHTQFTHPGDGI